MTTHYSILPWRIPGTEEPDGLQSIGSQRVRHNLKQLSTARHIYIHTHTHIYTYTHTRTHTYIYHIPYLLYPFIKTNNLNTFSIMEKFKYPKVERIV